jgi:hypothetical protein
MRFALNRPVVDSIMRVQHPRRRWPYAVMARGQSFLAKGKDQINSARSAVSRFRRKHPEIFITSQKIRPGIIRFTRLQ